MNKLTKVILAVAATTALSTGAHAAFSGMSATNPYVGVKAGQFKVDNLPNTTAYGVYGGLSFDKNFGAEVEYVGSQDKTYYKDNNGVNAKYNVKSFGAYGTYRYHFANTPVYAKAKLGLNYAKSKAEAVVSNNGVVLYEEKGKGSKTSLSGGVGIGFTPIPNVGVEAEYSYVNDDVNLISVGAHYNF